MKSRLTLLLLIISLITLYSQNGKKNYKTELGLNITNTFKSIFSINSQTSLLNDPYTISLKIKAGKPYVRMGTFFSVSGKEDFSDFNGVVRIDEKSIGIRIGLEARSNSGKRLEFLYGFDFISQYTDRITEQEIFDSVTGKSFTVSTGNKIPTLGLGPIIGLIFNINSRVSLFTESSIYLLYTKNTKIAKVDPSIPKTSTVTESWKVQHLIPQSLFVSYKF